jgi:hypothetical protein
MKSDPVGEVKRTCELLKPQIIGFSLRNLDTARFHYEDTGEKTFLDELIRLINASRVEKSLVVLGGSGFSIAPSQILKSTCADAGFVGTSEFDFAEFCFRVVVEKLGATQAAVGLASVILPGQQSSQAVKANLGQPSHFETAAVEYAKLIGGTIPIRTKSGCSMNCSYCVVPSIEKVNLRPWLDIRNELRLIVDAGLGDRVFIADGEFNLPSVEHAIDLCHRINAEFRDSVRWTCYLEAGYVTRELLCAMRSAGCVGISLTADAFASPSRIGLIKVTKPDIAVRAARLCLESGIQTDINLLFGGPNETLETAITTSRIAKQLNQEGATLTVTIGLRVYPNTPLSTMVKKDRYRPYFRACQQYDWLGLFCCPVPASELVHYIRSTLPPSETVSYCNTRTINERDDAFYHQVAIGADMLASRDFTEAKEHFVAIKSAAPTCVEAHLGLLKAEHGLLESVPG